MIQYHHYWAVTETSLRYPAAAPKSWSSYSYCYVRPVPLHISAGHRCQGPGGSWAGQYKPLRLSPQATGKAISPRPMTSGTALPYLCWRVRTSLFIAYGGGNQLSHGRGSSLAETGKAFLWASEGQGWLSMTLRFQHIWYLWKAFVTGAMDIRLDLRCCGNKDPDMTYIISQGSDDTMTPCGCSDIQIRVSQVLAWSLDTNMARGWNPDPVYTCVLWWYHGPQTLRKPWLCYDHGPRCNLW